MTVHAAAAISSAAAHMHSPSSRPSSRSSARPSPSSRHTRRDSLDHTPRSRLSTTRSSRRASSPPRPAWQAETKLVYEMAVDSASVADISALAATARSLYRRAKTSGADFDDVAAAVRSLHAAVKHLRAEAEDPDSLLNGAQKDASLYARQLTPIIEDADFTLKQLDTILEKYGSCAADDGDHGRRPRPSNASGLMEDRERNMVTLIRTKLANQKTHIDMFLDTVQLHNPAKQHQPVDLGQVDDRQQNAIKDKVDAVAARLFQRRARARAAGDAEESEDQMWQQFWTELVKEGFSSDVLRKHREVLRAYIRELDPNGSVDENPPSVRGLLDHANNTAYTPHHYYPPPPAAAAATITTTAKTAAASAYNGSSRQPQQYGSSPLPPPPPPPPVATNACLSRDLRGETVSGSPKELVSPALDNEKFMPSLKLERRRPEQSPVGYNRPYQPPAPTSMPAQLSYERSSTSAGSSSDDTDSSGSQQLALISTRDLMDCDRRDADALTTRMGSLHLSPALYPSQPGYGVSPGTSPSGHFLPPPSTYRGPSILSKEHQLSSSPSSQNGLGTSPRCLPPLPPYGASPVSSTMTPPPAYSTANTPGAAPIPISSSAPPEGSAFPPPSVGNSAPRYSRLAPDSKGADIPLDAKWTCIKRSLVSPEVLQRAGLRYEARPEFVAVLGVLTREQIADFAKKSAAVRASRSRRDVDIRSSSHHYPDEKRGAKSSPPRRSGGWHESDSESGIIDESDSSDSDSEERGPHSRTRERSGSATDKYIPREYRRRHRSRRDSSTSVIMEEPELEPDGRKRSRTYPIIVQPPSDEKGTPAATVAPKPILKNRNENHVRFDADGPREMSMADLEKERERKERRERRRSERERDGGSDRRRRSDRDRDRDRDHDRERERERDREQRYRDRDHHSSSSSHYRHRGGDRDREEARDRRRARKSVRGETLGAVGIGAAAASLLSVLTEAAAGF